MNVAGFPLNLANVNLANVVENERLLCRKLIKELIDVLGVRLMLTAAFFEPGFLLACLPVCLSSTTLRGICAVSFIRKTVCPYLRSGLEKLFERISYRSLC